MPLISMFMMFIIGFKGMVLKRICTDLQSDILCTFVILLYVNESYVKKGLRFTPPMIDPSGFISEFDLLTCENT